MASDDPLIGKQIGNYRLLAKINSGSFGSVYLGKHVIFDDDPVVAIKLLTSTLHSQQERDEFIKEARVLKKLNHPHILRVLDAGFQDNVPYIVTEYAAGGSLRDRLNKTNGKPLTLEEATNILIQIGQALHYTHEQHIIHRDLKPENNLFNSQGEVLLADFGIAIILASNRTGLVGIGGTYPYMAPEQFEGLASPKSDQYALGCIAYELVTGHQLYSIPTPSLEAYWYHHKYVEPAAPTAYQPHLPTYIEQAILTALAKDRTKRYSDVSTFGKALLKSSKEWREEGLVHYRAKRYQEALTAFDQAIRFNPNDALTHYNKGQALGYLKRYEEAITAFDQAIRLDPGLATAYYNKGGILSTLKRYKEALTAYGQAFRLDPHLATSYRDEDVTLYHLKRYQETLAALEQAFRLDPNINFNRWPNEILSLLEHYQKILAAYERAIRLDPKDAIAYNNKGNALSNLKRYQEALTAYEQAIRLGPNHADAYRGKGYVLLKLERYQEALAAYEQAIRLNPDVVNAYYGKGEALHWLNRDAEALAVYDEAINFDESLEIWNGKLVGYPEMGWSKEA